MHESARFQGGGKSLTSPGRAGGLKICEPLKAVKTVSYLKVALLVEHLELIELLILVFLLSDVVADRFFIQSCRCHIIAPGPKILADEVFSPSHVRAIHMALFPLM